MDAAAEVQQTAAETAQPIAKPARAFYITPENAKLLQSKAVLARARIKAENAVKIAKAAADTELARPLLEKAVALAVETTAEPDAQYRVFRLQRTREQLLALDKQLSACKDPKLVKSLADAIARLCDVEQKLAMRPLPGSRRPGREPQSKTPGTFEPSE